MDLSNVEVFKVGTHTDSAGNVITYTAEDLNQIAEKYNNQPEDERHTAPAVVGHPVDNSPAYGWVDKLKVVGDKLVADFVEMTESFVDSIKKGEYKKRSISLYPDGLLQHVGWLGGVPPAVKGLADVQFADQKKNRTFEFSEYADPVIPDAPAQDGTTTTTGKETRKAQYGLTLLQNIGYDQKPARYSDLADDDFADPVNYRFPLVEESIKANLEAWNREATTKQYTTADKAFITARLITAAVRFGYELPSYWCYNEAKNQVKIYNEYIDVHPTMLSKSQLVKILTGDTTTTKETQPNPSVTTNQEAPNMDPLEQMRKDLIQWITDTFGADAGAQTDAKWTELAAKLNPAAAPAEAGATGAAPATNNSEFSEVQILRNQVKELQKVNRVNENSNFCENAVKEGQLVPAQKTVVLEILEAIHTTPVSNFSEGNKTVAISPVVAFKSFIGTLKQVDYSEQANTDRANPASGDVPSDYKNADQETVKQDKQISEYMAKNTTLTYEQAAFAVSKGAK